MFGEPHTHEKEADRETTMKQKSISKKAMMATKPRMMKQKRRLLWLHVRLTPDLVNIHHFFVCFCGVSL